MLVIPVITGSLSTVSIIVGMLSTLLSPVVGTQQGFLIGLMQFGIGLLLLGIGLFLMPIAKYSIRYLVRFSVGLVRLMDKIFKSRLKEIR